MKAAIFGLLGIVVLANFIVGILNVLQNETNETYDKNETNDKNFLPENLYSCKHCRVTVDLQFQGLLSDNLGTLG